MKAVVFCFVVQCGCETLFT